LLRSLSRRWATIGPRTGADLLRVNGPTLRDTSSAGVRWRHGDATGIKRAALLTPSMPSRASPSTRVMNRNAAQAMRHWQQTDTARPRAERRAASGERRAAPRRAGGPRVTRGSA
jgi:hypothetical protein